MAKQFSSQETINTGQGGDMKVTDFSAVLSSFTELTSREITKTFKNFDTIQSDVAEKQKKYQDDILKAAKAVAATNSAADRQKLESLQREKQAIDSLSKTLEAAAEEQKKRTSESISKVSGVLGIGGAGGVVSDFMNFTKGGGISLLGKAIEFIKDLLFAANEQAVKISHAFQVSSEDADKMRDSIIAAGRGEVGLLANANNRIKAYEEMLSISKMIYIASDDQVNTQIKLVEAMGMSSDEASRLNELFTANNTEGSAGTRIAFEQVALFAKQEGQLFNSKKILQDVSNVSGQIRAAYKGSVEELTKAVLQAAKLGTTIEQTKSMSEGLLNFETSIDNELRAELLTGQQLNLEKARALALSGDYVAAGKEMLEQAGGLENYQRLNVIQQKALAESIGMSADQMSDVLFKQTVQGKQATGLAAQYRSMGDLEMARALEAGEIQGEQLEKAQERLTAERQFAEAMEQVKSAIGSLVAGGWLDKMAELVQDIAMGFSAVVIDLKAGRGILDILWNGVSSDAQAKVAQSQLESVKTRESEGKMTSEEASVERKKINDRLREEAFNMAKEDATGMFDSIALSFKSAFKGQGFAKTQNDQIASDTEKYFKELLAAVNTINSKPATAIISRNQMDVHGIDGKVPKPK